MAEYEHVDVKSLKVAELKDELSKRGLETTGLKKDLADRLQKAQDLATSGGTELAPPSELDKLEAMPPKEMAKVLEKQQDHHEENKQEEGVGHAMVEGAEEVAGEMEEKADEEAKDSKEDMLQPKVLDDEVAEVVRREELKERMTPTPSPPRAISPAPPSNQPSRQASPSIDKDQANDQRSDDVLTPPLPTTSLSSAEPSTKRGREEEQSAPGPSKRSRPAKVYDTPLPSNLSHLLHPPTSVLYISNLKRPLLLGSLHDYVLSSTHPDDLLPAPRGPFASEDAPGLWLSGIKDHAFATFPSPEEALAVAEKIEGVRWPEDTGAELHVEFIPDEKLLDLVQQEELAWANSRQKMSLRIEKKEDGEVEFSVAPSGPGGARGNAAGSSARPTGPRGLANGGVAPRPGGPSLTGANAVGRAPHGAPTGPTAMGARGRGGYGGAAPWAGRNGEDGRFGGRQQDGPAGRSGRDGPSFGPGGFGGQRGGRMGYGTRMTRARPALSYKEGPGAVRS